MNKQKFERLLRPIAREEGIHIYQPNNKQPHYLYYISTWLHSDYDQKAEIIEKIEWWFREFLSGDDNENIDDIHINKTRGTLTYTDEKLQSEGKLKEKADIEYHLSQGGKSDDIFPVEGKIRDMHINKLTEEIFGIKNFKNKTTYETNKKHQDKFSNI